MNFRQKVKLVVQHNGLVLILFWVQRFSVSCTFTTVQAFVPCAFTQIQAPLFSLAIQMFHLQGTILYTGLGRKYLITQRYGENGSVYLYKYLVLYLEYWIKWNPEADTISSHCTACWRIRFSISMREWFNF